MALHHAGPFCIYAHDENDVLAQPIGALHTQLASVQTVLAAETVPPGPELNNLVDRLGLLIARADQEL